jgi:serine/threonine-protein kinase
LFAVPFDLATLRTEGTPVTVLPRILTTAVGTAHFAVGGPVLAYIDASTPVAVPPVWIDRQGREEPIVGLPPRYYSSPRLSPDGTKVALMVVDEGIWVWDLGARNLTQLTVDHRDATFPVWTQDNAQVLFSAQLGEGYGLFRQAASAALAPPRHWPPIALD